MQKILFLLPLLLSLHLFLNYFLHHLELSFEILNLIIFHLLFDFHASVFLWNFNLLQLFLRFEVLLRFDGWFFNNFWANVYSRLLLRLGIEMGHFCFELKVSLLTEMEPLIVEEDGALSKSETEDVEIRCLSFIKL